MKKRIVSVIVLIVILLTTIGCIDKTNGRKKSETYMISSIENILTSYINPLDDPNNYKDIKISLPGKDDIIRDGGLYGHENSIYRYCYYQIDDIIRSLSSPEEANDFEEEWTKKYPYGTEIQSCYAKEFIIY